jgi:hypothetical protein
MRREYGKLEIALKVRACFISGVYRVEEAVGRVNQLIDQIILDN